MLYTELMCQREWHEISEKSKSQLVIIGSEESAVATGDLGVTLSVCVRIWVVVVILMYP